MYKGPMDKTKVGKNGEWEVVVDVAGESGGGKMKTIVFKQQFKKL